MQLIAVNQLINCEDMHMPEPENIFEISVESVQREAERMIGRRLTDDELYSVQKGFEAGLNFDIDTVYRTAIEDAVESCSAASD